MIVTEQYVLILMGCKKGNKGTREINLEEIEPSKEFIGSMMNEYRAQSAKIEKRYINNTFYFDGELKVATGGLVTSTMPIGKIGGHTTV